MTLPSDLFYPLIALATMVTAASLIIYLKYPVLLLQFYFRFSVLASGMRIKYIKQDGYTICYGEKGKPKKGVLSMLLVHGFTADKFMWVPLVKSMKGDVHVIAIDLPGHGDSDTPAEHEDIRSHMTTVEKLHKFIQVVGLTDEPFHLVGMSVGGALAGLYASQHNSIKALTLICPAMQTPYESPFWANMKTALDSGIEDIHDACSLLFPQTSDEVQSMLDFVQYHKMFVPTQILQGVVDVRKKYYPFYKRLFSTLVDPDNHCLLESFAHKIKAPTQVIWGENDQVIDVSGVSLLKEKLPNCIKVDIIPHCGHSITTDRPGALIKAISGFREMIMSLEN
ncbi:hypothetical protein CHS0354_029937 [Potamilus streckersoni]|uniref:acylglycerol lipase n=1 Tax=Potamilus streckersoni TaxID=2493646 RepID=A0AAE0VJF8_9BIVA|nr:hypothetical protein CHS0354_029937 [Potamilus streckersoni]